MMKNNIVILFLLTISISSYAQENEWHTIVDQLQKEADYFKGKKGYIRLTTQKYNTFTIEAYTITDTLFAMELKLFDRYETVEGHDFKKQELKFDFILEQPVVGSAEIIYGSDFYFEDYPYYVFLKLTFSDVYALLDKEERTHISIPIRRKQLERILKTIDAYQKKTLSIELARDRTH